MSRVATYEALLSTNYSPATIPQLAAILQRANYVANGAKSCTFNVSTTEQFKDAVNALHWLCGNHKGMIMQGGFTSFEGLPDGSQVSVSVSDRFFRVVYRESAQVADVPKLAVSEPILFEKEKAK